MSLARIHLPILLLTTLTSSICLAKVSEHTAQLLGATLTPLGAEVAGNADTSIPAWTADRLVDSNGTSSSRIEVTMPEAFFADQPLFSITSENYQNHADKLSEGQKALLSSYRDTFTIPVYPSHRNGQYSKWTEVQTRWNATHTNLIGDSDGLSEYSGGVPFPIPHDGEEVMWNAKLNHPVKSLDILFDEVAVFSNGVNTRHRRHVLFETPFAYTDYPVGTTMDKIGPKVGLFLIDTISPIREKGKKILVQELFDGRGYSRNAWMYMPGVNRVRRLPEAGFDMPDGPGGLKTADDNLGFNGSMKRYRWQLIGKKEVYIPYHNNRFDTPMLQYTELLTPLHISPDFMRFELHRVWVVEASLKSGHRHLYAKRRFYIDEDSWLVMLIDTYDNRGELWRVGIQNTVYDSHVKGYIVRNLIMHDLQTKAYVVSGLVNDTRPPRFNHEPKGIDFFTPSNLRTLGRN